MSPNVVVPRFFLGFLLQRTTLLADTNPMDRAWLFVLKLNWHVLHPATAVLEQESSALLGSLSYLQGREVCLDGHLSWHHAFLRFWKKNGLWIFLIVCTVLLPVCIEISFFLGLDLSLIYCEGLQVWVLGSTDSITTGLYALDRVCLPLPCQTTFRLFHTFVLACARIRLKGILIFHSDAFLEPGTV